jgi:flagellar hook-length control protein FliK
MTMHTTSLPISLNAPAAPAASPRANPQPASGGVDFGATLTRQMEQRQVEQRQTVLQPQAAAPAPQAGPKPQAPAKPAANEAKSASREMVKQAAKETAHPETTKKAEGTQSTAAEEKTVATAEGESKEEDSSADAKVADAVVDMLALVASFNQAQQAAAPAPLATPAPAVQTDTLLSSMKEVRREGAEPLVKLKGDTGIAAVTEESQNKAEPGVDLRALDLGKTADAAKLPVEAGDFAAKLRDSTHHPDMKEAAPGPEALNSLTAQASALQTAQATGSTPTDRLSARVGTPAWDNQVGQKVIWMVGGEDQSATLELNPPDLGPVQVVLNVSNDLASVTFSSQQLEVRQALENALPRLREMMSESGIALGNATVNAGAEGRQGQDGQGAGGSGRGRGGNGGGDSDVAEVVPRQRTRVIGGAGAVDTFA